MPLTKINTSGIADDAITSAKIASGVVSASDVADGTLTTAKLEDSAITTAKINDSAVTGAKLSTPLDLSSTVITAPKIANGGFIADANGNEQIKFTTTTSAVNEFTITNSATGNAPALSVTGGDTNLDLTITPKGLGLVTFNGGGKIQHLAEKVTIAATAATGTINYDVLTQAVLYYTSNASANWTLNIRGDSSNSLNNVMDTGESITIAHLVTMTTAYYNSAVQVDGNAVTPE